MRESTQVILRNCKLENINVETMDGSPVMLCRPQNLFDKPSTAQEQGSRVLPWLQPTYLWPHKIVGSVHTYWTIPTNV